MFRKNVIQAVLFVLYLSMSRCYAETVDVTLQIRNEKNDEKIINRANLTTIKEFIIKNGLRETYSQMFNNNPAYHSKNFAFYLNPDTGQKNVNCEIDKSDFQTLVICDSQRKNQYCRIDFTDTNVINVSISSPSDDLTISQIREFASEAIQEILAAITKEAPAPKPQPKISADAKDIQDAINLAIQALYKEPHAFAANFVLASAERIFWNNKWVWRVTFLTRDPKSDYPDYTGKGNQEYITVDLNTRETFITYGK